MRTRAIVVLAALLILGNAVPSAAQYFGRNKVQYKKVDFHVLKTANFDIYYYPEEQKGIAIVALPRGS